MDKKEVFGKKYAIFHYFVFIVRNFDSQKDVYKIYKIEKGHQLFIITNHESQLFHSIT